MESNSIKFIDVKRAWQLIRNDPNSLLVDIRSSMEFLLVGHPSGAVNIPWLNDENWEINPNFSHDVMREIDKKQSPRLVKTLLICRSGRRSIEAAKALHKTGLAQIYHVENGFEGQLNEQLRRSSVSGWRYAGLPWEQC